MAKAAGCLIVLVFLAVLIGVISNAGHRDPPAPNAQAVPASPPPLAQNIAAPIATEPAKPAPEPAPTHPTDLVVSDAGAVEALYSQNEVKADAEMEGKLFAVRGVVRQVGKDILGNPYVTLTSGSGVLGVVCQFESADEGALGALHAGQQLTIAGTGAGKALGPVMKECWIYDSEGIQQAAEEKQAAEIAAARRAEKEATDRRAVEHAAKIDAAKWHVWRAAEGGFSVDAKFVSLSFGDITLEKRDGSRIKVKKEILSPADREWIEKRGWESAK